MRRFDPARLIEALRQEHDIPPPKGWLTVEQIRQELKLAHARNASSRACDLARRGLLERQPHQFKAGTGQCHRAYIYRPLPPYRSVREASEKLSRHNQDIVPKGWARIVDLAVELRVSDVAVRGRVSRAGLKPRYFKTSRGIIGLHRNAYYLKADILRLYRKAS
jgi:hypothetical protein